MASSVSHNEAGPGATQVNNVTNHYGPISEQEIDRTCLDTLRCPDSRKIKNRLKSTKDELLRDSYKWILSDSQYCRWRDGDDLGLLWIKGGAGKGKTMMSIGLTEELARYQRRNSAVIYFFCQNADYELNTVTAVIKGLIFRLIEYQGTLTKVLRKNWDVRKNAFIIDTEDWQTLWDILLEMLDEVGHTRGRIFIVIDALDEVQPTSLPDFLRTIIRTGLQQPKRVKYLLTSRPVGDLEHELTKGASRIHVSLELNAAQVDNGIQNYIHYRVQKLALLHRYNAITTHAVEEAVRVGANGAFLWASLVCNQLQGVPPNEAVSRVRQTPPELERLYDHVYTNLCAALGSEVSRCLKLLQVLMLAYRPLNIPELIGISVLTDNLAENKRLIDRCSTFIRSRSENTIEYIEFVHQSARDYLIRCDHSSSQHRNATFDHDEMSARCLSHLTEHLHTNILRGLNPSATRKELLAKGDEQLTTSSYAAQFWVDHLHAATQMNSTRSTHLKDEVIDTFLRFCFLEWVECLTLLNELPRAVGGLETLLNIVKGTGQSNQASPYLSTLEDTYRFLRRHYDTILRWPLQVYISAVFFSPASSQTRQENLWRLPRWLQDAPSLESQWSPLQQTLRGHSSGVHSVVLSPDGRLVASGGADRTVKLWDVKTGETLQSLKEEDTIQLVAFSPDGQWLAFCTKAGNVKIWEIKTNKVRHIVKDRRNPSKTGTRQQVFSPGIHWFACTDESAESVRIWNLDTGQYKQTITRDGHFVMSLAFSPDDDLLALARGAIIELWQVKTGQVQRDLEGPVHSITSMAFSPDGLLLASRSRGGDIDLFCVETGQIQQTLPSRLDLEIRTKPGLHFAWSPNGQLIAFVSYDAVIVLDVKTGQKKQRLTGHSYHIESITFSPDGELIVSGGSDSTVKIWVVETNQSRLKEERQEADIWSIRIRNGEIETDDVFYFKVWDAETGLVKHTIRTCNLQQISDLRKPKNKLVELRRNITKLAGSSKRLRVKHQWLLCGSTRVLEFPLEYIVSCYDEDGDMCAIGFKNGRMYRLIVDREVLNEGCAAYTGSPAIARSSSMPANSGQNLGVPSGDEST